MSLSNSFGIKNTEKSLNALSGVVAVDIIDNQAVAHCGDELDKNVLLNAVNNADMSATIISETADE